MLASWRKSVLVKRLWKLRHETDSEAEDHELKSMLNSLLKRLNESELEALVLSIESKGVEMTSCVHVKMNKHSLTLDPRTLLCGLYRWPHILEDEEKVDIQPLEGCSSDEEESCCNPYHHTVVVAPTNTHISPATDTERTPYQLSLSDDFIDSSTETGLTPSYELPETGDSLTSGGHHTNYWCVIAYWEHRRRLGRLFTVSTPSINVFQHLPHGDGVSLCSLQTESPENDNVKRTRTKIGLGIRLSQREDDVWVYNLSDYPVFVNSPCLDNPDSRTFSVHKLLSGYSMKVFDYSEPVKNGCDDGPFDPCAIRISFCKGWGANYSRQFITSCPCWLEILLRRRGS